MLAIDISFQSLWSFLPPLSSSSLGEEKRGEEEEGEREGEGDGEGEGEGEGVESLLYLLLRLCVGGEKEWVGELVRGPKPSLPTTKNCILFEGEGGGEEGGKGKGKGKGEMEKWCVVPFLSPIEKVLLCCVEYVERSCVVGVALWRYVFYLFIIIFVFFFCFFVFLFFCIFVFLYFFVFFCIFLYFFVFFCIFLYFFVFFCIFLYFFFFFFLISSSLLSFKKKKKKRQQQLICRSLIGLCGCLGVTFSYEFTHKILGFLLKWSEGGRGGERGREEEEGKVRGLVVCFVMVYEGCTLDRATVNLGFYFLF